MLTKESFPLTGLEDISWLQPHCILGQSLQKHQLVLLWPPPPHNPPGPGFPAKEKQGPSSPSQAADLDSRSPSTAHLMLAQTPADPLLPALVLCIAVCSPLPLQHNLVLRLSVQHWPVNSDGISCKPVRTAGMTPRDQLQGVKITVLYRTGKGTRIIT